MSERSAGAKSKSSNKRQRKSSPNPQKKSQGKVEEDEEERPVVAASFFDAAGVVAPGIFAARRLIETKRLYQESSSCPWNKSSSNINTQCYQSGGGKTSSRHLRRRTTSYNTRKWHRYPTGGFAAATTSNVGATQPVSDGNEANKEADKDSGEPTSAAKAITTTESNNVVGQQGSMSRRGRRKNSTTLKSLHESWRRMQPISHGHFCSTSDNNNQEGNDETSREMNKHYPPGRKDADDAIIATDESEQAKTVGAATATIATTPLLYNNNSATVVNWIPTHIWHAKRFHMHQHCGWKIPLLHCDRGTKAAVRLVCKEEKCLIQDVTWRMQPLVLQITNVQQNNNMGKAKWSQQLLLLLQTALARVIVPPIKLDIDIIEKEEEAAVNENNGVIMGQGMLHGVDEFPRGALGPVIWMLRKTPLLIIGQQQQNANDGDETNGSSQGGASKVDDCCYKYIYLYLWVDPSIRQCAIEVLTAAAAILRVEPPAAKFEGNLETAAGPTTNTDYVDICSTSVEGIAYLQLRGKRTLQCLVAALESVVSSSVTPPFDLAPLKQVASLAAKANETSHNIRGFKIISLPSLATRDNGPPHQQPVNNNIILISQCPRNPSLSFNYGVCGYDIICDPSIASALHLALVVKGGACPIGLAEEAALQLEGEPPIPIFPRDYPDTQQGKAYWASHSLPPSSSSNKASTKQSMVSVSSLVSIGNWKMIRAFFEGGQGRIRHQHVALAPLSWHSLVSDNDDIDECSIICTDNHPHHDKKQIVMVHGEAFGKPFVDALMGCCTTSSNSSSSVAVDDSNKSKPRRHRRRRRSTHNPTHCVLAPLLSKRQTTEHQAYLAKLVESLSLPAVLLCHVQMSNGGPGTMSSGALIHAMDESTVEPLGFCTTGAFSQSRGRFHGLAIVGAARILRALVASATATLSSVDSVKSLKQQQQQHQHAAVLVPRMGDSQALLRQVQLRVRILDKSVWYEASLALML